MFFDVQNSTFVQFPILCPYTLFALYLPFLLKLERKTEICPVKIINFIKINMTLIVIFMILRKKFVSYVLNILTGTVNSRMEFGAQDLVS
jgi:hypothetical protein